MQSYVIIGCMNEQEIKLQLDKDSKPFSENMISVEDLRVIDAYLLENSGSLSTECVGIYKKFVEMKNEAPESMKNDLFRVIKSYIAENIEQKHYNDALLMNRFLIVKSKLDVKTYYNIAENLFFLGKTDVSKIFIELYKKVETNIPLKLLTIANFYNLYLKDYKTAIKYYEEYIKIEETKSVIFTTLAGLYKKLYGDESLSQQIYYYEKAHYLKPKERLPLHFLAFSYEKLQDKVNADKYYKLLLENNPTEIDYYNYGGFLISCGNLYEGHKYLAHRFNIDDENLKYPSKLDIKKKYDFKTDISDKVILVHYEQGFGDTFMYCRFVPLLKDFCKKVILVVQNEVYELIKNSNLISRWIEIFSDSSDISCVNYDYSVALLDLPYILKTTASTIPYVDGYLKVDVQALEEYKIANIKKSDNLKVGIAYRGSQKANYEGRDITLNYLAGLFSIDNIDFYSFDMENSDSDSRIINLSTTFNDFTQTACALKCMDIVISTDNVILNLAGALGVKTYGLFNKYPNFRWYKLSGSDIGWYKSVIPLQVEENELWTPVISKILNILKEMSVNKTLFLR